MPETRTVFIIFSKRRSRLATELVESYLKSRFGDQIKILQSQTAIKSGDELQAKVADLPHECDFAVVCLTEENRHNPWIVGEATAVRYLEKPIYFLVVPPGDFAQVMEPRDNPLASLAIPPASLEELAQQISHHLNLSLAKDKAATPDERERLKSLDKQASLAPGGLAELVESCWTIDEGKNPIDATIRNEILSEAASALSSLKQAYHSSPDRYTKQIEDQLELFKGGSAMVLALCGHKGLRTSDIRPYFDQFFSWARSLAPDQHPGLIRIFVVNKEGTLHPETREPYAWHGMQGPNVVGPLVNLDGRKALESDYPGLVDQLDSGYGFVLFLSDQRATLVTHSGEPHHFYMSVSGERLVINGALKLFGKFMEVSDAKEWVKARTRELRLKNERHYLL